LIKWLVRKDPLNSIIKILPGLGFYYQGEVEPAREFFEITFLSDKDDPLVLWHYGRVLAAGYHTDQAITILNRCTEKGRFVIARFSQLLSLALQNRKQDVLNAITPDIDCLAKKDWLASLWLAECLSVIGEDVEAMNYLEQAVNLGGINFPFLTKHDRFLTNLWDDPRCRQIVHNVKAKYQAEHESVMHWLEEVDHL